MNDRYLKDFCRDKKWNQVREFLDSDSSNKDKKDKKRQQVVRHRRGNGRTCLHHACYNHPPVDIMKALLDIGGKDLVIIASSRKRTALHIACDNGASINVVKMLINFGGKEFIVAKDNGGDTALHYLCRHINRYNNATANKIKLMLQVPGTETILTEKNKDGKTPLDIATAKGASDEIKALLQPRAINNDPSNTNDDTSIFVPDDLDNDTTTVTELLQVQLQAAIADLEIHRAEHILLATTHQGQLQAANQKNVDLEHVIANQKAENVLLSEQNGTQIQDQAAYQKKIADLEDKIETQETDHLTTIAHLSIETQDKKARQDADITSWKGRVENLTEICSELKVELQQLKESSRHEDQIQAANQTIADLENEIENQNVLLSKQTANRFQDQSAHQKISNLEKKNALLSEQKTEQENEIAYWKGRVNILTEICSELKVELQQLKDSTRVTVAHIKRERDTDDGTDPAPATQSRSSKRSRVGSTTNVMHSDSKDD